MYLSICLLTGISLLINNKTVFGARNGEQALSGPKETPLSQTPKGRRDRCPSVLLSAPKHVLASRLPRDHRYPLHISEPMLAPLTSSPTLSTLSPAAHPPYNPILPAFCLLFVSLLSPVLWSLHPIPISHLSALLLLS